MRWYPRLAERLPWVMLGSLPTRIDRTQALERAAGFGPIFAKRDDLSSRDWGGGKTRKLELLLGEAIAAGKEAVITFGGAGSNQAVATAVHGRRLGLRVVLALAGQPPSDTVRSRLLDMLGAGAELRYVPGVTSAELGAREDFRRRRDAAPWVIPTGGTSPLGSLAFVDAALELADQVRSGVAPEPDTIYLAGGTLGTAAGLCLGLRLAGLRSRVVAVRASSPALSTRRELERLVADTIRYARDLDPGLPPVGLDPASFAIDGSELGRGYGHETAHGRAARELALGTEQWQLEDTYTSKTLAALLATKPSGVSLLWLTQSACRARVVPGEPSALPPPLRRYFSL
jgi:D-cysteine desulfhydrase